MNSSSFGSIVSPHSARNRNKTGMPVMRMRAPMPRMMKHGKGTGVPSMGGLASLQKFASGGLANPSFSSISTEAAMRGAPQMAIPEFLLSRMMADGGLTGPADPFDFPNRLSRRMDRGIDEAYYDLAQRPTRRNEDFARWRPGVAQRPQVDPNRFARIDRDTMGALERMGSAEEMPPADLSDFLTPDMLADLATITAKAPAAGWGPGLALYAGEAGAPTVRGPRKDKIDMRAIEENARRPHPHQWLRRILGARR